MKSKSKKININYNPLQTSFGIITVGSVPNIQHYNVVSQEYTPDYTLTPLVLYPKCTATDPMAITTYGNVNSQLSSVKWFEWTGNVRKEIALSSSEYEIQTTGDTKGTIKVKKNVSVNSPITLEFQAEYVDTRTAHTFKFTGTAIIRCMDASQPQASLVIDSPSSRVWNPAREKNPIQTIKANVIVGKTDVTETDNCRIFWYRQEADGTLVQITGTGEEEYEIEALTKNECTINRDYMGQEITIVCKSTYDPEGNPAEQPAATDPSASTVIRRRIPSIECDWAGVPAGVADGTTVIKPKPIVRDTKGVLDLPEDTFRFFWYVKKPSDSDYTLVANCKYPTIPFTDGMILKLEVEDRGYFVMLTHGQKAVTADGIPVFIRKNG